MQCGAFTIGEWFGLGKEGVAHDVKIAFAWYHKAACQGHKIAQYNLGTYYRYELGVAADDLKALEWYTKSAHQGYARAQCSLGNMYETGRGVAQADLMPWNGTTKLRNKAL